MVGSQDDIPPPPPPSLSQTPTQQTPYTVSTIKLPILKITDAKEMWESIRSRFGGNEESKKNKANDNSKRLGKKEESNALMTLNGEGVDWTSHSEEEEYYALMACSSSGSDTE
ncbi:hypothetical protein Tco_1479209, partial [Tanacetum coccineum]